MICKNCKEDKDLNSFYIRKETGRPRLECKPCFNSRVSVWQSKNRDKVRGYVRKSCKKAYDNDPEKFKEKSKNLRDKNPEAKREIVRKSYRKIYAEQWPAQRARLNALSAARRRASPPWLTAIHKAQIQEFYDIAKCKSVQTGIQHHVDHIIPINGEFVSGLHVPWNLQILTAAENCAKKNRVEA